MYKILIIEDEVELLENLKFLLELEDYQVAAFPNGKDGADYAINYPIDLIVCDINMPGLDGYQVLEIVRNNSLTKNIPFIFLTAKSNLDDQRQGMDLGADDYISKPYSDEVLLSAIKARLHKHNLIKDEVNTEVNITNKNIASTLPHELNTPLTIISTYADMLLQNGDNMGKAEIKDVAEVIKTSAKRLNKMFNSYLFFVNLFNFNKEDSPILTPNVFSLMRNCIKTKPEYINERIVLQFPEERDVTLLMNQEHFEKMMCELIDNAIKFSDDVHNIVVKAKQINDILEICISNTGAEFKDLDIRNIGAFKQFNRAYYEQQGIGLGLGIVKKIMELYGYTFRIFSNNGYTQVKLRLPVKMD